MRILYGPIHSWRFGRSLGVDPLAQREKRCPLSCIYCQYGETTHPTCRRQVFITVEQMCAELEALGPFEADCATFAGLGEPTLAANLPELVTEVRRALSLPVIILTGGALMPLAEARHDLLTFDAVVVKLDAPDEALFRRINRPSSGFRYPFNSVVKGLHQFRSAYAGQFILQMMFVQANKEAAAQMAALACTLEPDQVQLNTPLQPALGGPLSEAEMREIELLFSDLPFRSVYQARITPRTM